MNHEDGQNADGGVQPRTARFLIAALHPAGPAETAALWAALADQPHTRVLRHIESSPPQAVPFGQAAEELPNGTYPGIAVAEMPISQATQVARWPQVLIEPDLPLTYDPPPTWGAGLGQPDPYLLIPLREPVLLHLRVQDGGGAAVPGAFVTVIGSAATAYGVTGADGRVSVMLAADTAATVRTVVVRPASGYWAARIDSPGLADGALNPIVVTAITASGEAPGERQHTGWGPLAMHVSDLPAAYRGEGIKVALIDAGIAASHPALTGRVTAGMTVAGDAGWDADATGHGTWCAGVIAGKPAGAGLAGIAGAAELHSLKLFPGGYTSDLITALGYCIENRIDIAQISLTTGSASQLATWKLQEAHANGVACVAGAGDHAGPVTFPAAVPSVLTAGALGQARQSLPGTVAAGWETSAHISAGWFLPQFTAYGGAAGSVDLCAPGVGILTTAAPVGYTVADGTGLAAAHITGLAALMLAHHEDFRDVFTERGSRRIDRLYGLIRGACSAVPLDDPRRTGAGLPDARRALSPVLVALST